jgi:hypothetical protein
MLLGATAMDLPPGGLQRLAELLAPAATSMCRSALQSGARRPFVAAILGDYLGEWGGRHRVEVECKAGDLTDSPKEFTPAEAAVLAEIPADHFPLFIVLPDGDERITSLVIPDRN